ncbi:cytosolic protein [Aquibacillus halophilus]|uniref:Cytosolic protein n=1 Tax=Aquibacillus halophilus TaxID=930132 RepID=A0A6A8DBI7_9BACI|nr:cytosolic protein [Aquibacillus halophilus]MRH42894.1 cytosolic protein [Aquibacillus halophilus]
MSFRQIISKYFNNHSETKEDHWDPKLKTHYFKTTKDRGFKSVEDFFKQSSKFEFVAGSEEHGEISANYKSGGRKAFVIATVIMVKPFRTAIDFSVTTESMIPFDLGHSHNLIPTLYNDLKKDLTYLETSR